MTRKFKEFNLQDTQIWMAMGFGFIALGCLGLVCNLIFQTWDYATTFTAFAFMGLLLMKVASNYYVHIFRENRDSDD